jgi:3-methyladenine DNA glycosylase AlkD
MTDKQAEEWVKATGSYPIGEMLARFMAKTPLWLKKAEKWSKSKDEFIGMVGWTLLALLALDDKSAGRTLGDDYFESYLKIIESHIHKRKNRVRHEMNGALIAIGMRNASLEKKALPVAAKIGKVEVDHGETNCKTPDATEYIQKARLYKHKKKAKAAAK